MNNKQMVKNFTIFFLLIMIFSLFGCGGDGNPNPTPTPTNSPVSPTPTNTLGTPTPTPTNTPGTLTVPFNMIRVPVPAGGISFPKYITDDGTSNVDKAYWLSQTEVTYELWDTVCTWAKSHGYNFAHNANRGGYIDGVTGGGFSSGHDTDPATNISWRDSMIWCNALTEWFNAYYGTNYDLVYYSDSSYNTPIKTSTTNAIPNTLISGAEDQPFIKASSSGNYDMTNCIAKGFRLPTYDEWQLASRYINDANHNGKLDPGEYYPGDHVSGDTTGYCYTGGTSINPSTIFGNYAWYWDNSINGSLRSTKSVKTKSSNALGFYDMSGNVWEYCFDWYSKRIFRTIVGGAWNSYTSTLYLSRGDTQRPMDVGTCYGFRPARND